MFACGQRFRIAQFRDYYYKGQRFTVMGVDGLRWLSSKFAGAALGIAAEHALKVVILLLGL
jgi:hypothetical protein